MRKIVWSLEINSNLDKELAKVKTQSIQVNEEIRQLQKTLKTLSTGSAADQKKLIEQLEKQGKSVQDLEKEYSDLLSEQSKLRACLLYTSPSPRDATLSRMPSSA